MPAEFDIRYDRRVSDEFLSHFLPGGVAERLNVIARKAQFPVDLQFRKSPSTGAEHASLYVGLTDVLKVSRGKRGQLRLSAHKTWATADNGFEAKWSQGVTPADLEADWVKVELYLERVIPKAVRSHGTSEGAVQAVVSKSMDREQQFLMLDREVTPSFRDNELKSQVLGELKAKILAAASTLDGGIKMPAAPKSLGSECDLLAIDAKGRLLAVEVKPLEAGSIAWVPAQAAMYAAVMQRWIDADSHAESGLRPRDVIAGMVAQRQKLGYGNSTSFDVPRSLEVVPVVVLQRGARPKQKEQMKSAAAAIDDALPDLPPIELFEVSITGELDQV